MDPEPSFETTLREPFKARCFRLLWRLAGRRPKLDHFFTSLLTHRRYLPERDAAEIIPLFAESEIKIKQCPIGLWSTPLVDVAVLLKAAIGFGSKRLLELGSFRGDTARLLAENTPDDAVVCAVDIDERHGSSYHGLPISHKIRRKTGRISPELFEPGEKFDFIFVDGDHDLKSVMRDSAVAFKLLAEPGVIFWHDYNQEAYFHGLCGVPEALGHFARTYPIYAVRGTWLAMYSTAAAFPETVSPAQSQRTVVPVWDETQLRG
jgi:predicted O-methyltransferase YrrM